MSRLLWLGYISSSFSSPGVPARHARLVATGDLAQKTLSFERGCRSCTRELTAEDEREVLVGAGPVEPLEGDDLVGANGSPPLAAISTRRRSDRRATARASSREVEPRPLRDIFGIRGFSSLHSPPGGFEELPGCGLSSRPTPVQGRSRPGRTGEGARAVSVQESRTRGRTGAAVEAVRRAVFNEGNGGGGCKVAA